jgi:6-phosphofructokinase 1
VGGKGKLLVGQSSGCTAVINASLAGVVEAALDADGVGDVLGMRHGIEGLLRGELVDLRAEPRDIWTAIRRTPSAALGSGRYKLREDDIARIVDRLRTLDVRYFIYIGGNDSADTAHKVALAAAHAGYDLCTVAVPKTIDNDLPVTDHCPGYGSIARFVSTVTQEAGLDTEAMRRVDPVKIIEVMGRDAGWVAASAGLGREREADAPHLIYMPERPLSRERFLRDIQECHERHGYAVAVVTETVRDESGESIARTDPVFSRDAFGHRYLTGAASYLADLVARELGLRARFDKPGTIQRMSMALASETDLREAYDVGAHAVRSALGGETDRMVTIERVSDSPYESHSGLAPLEEIANRQKLLPDEYIATEGNQVTPAFRAYALPLIGGQAATYPRLRGVPPRSTHL